MNAFGNNMLLYETHMKYINMLYR